MLSNRKATVSRLQYSLSDLLRGSSLEEWAEQQTSELLRASSLFAPPLPFGSASKLLRKRRITSVRYKPGLPERGRLVIERDGFAVELSPSIKQLASYSRLVLAHEVAHSFFYEIDTWPPLPLVSIESGSPDLEWLCWLLAKRLLVPKDWLREYVSGQPIPGQEGFSMRQLRLMQEVFKAPWRVIAQRLVEDLGIWHCVLLHFLWLPDRRNGIKSWHLAWQTRPKSFSKGLFIPMGTTQAGLRKFPRAHHPLAQFLSDCAKRGEKEEAFVTSMPHDLFKTSTTGNLNKFVGQQDTRCHCGVQSSPSQAEIFDFEIRKQFPSSVVLCIPLLLSA